MSYERNRPETGPQDPKGDLGTGVPKGTAALLGGVLAGLGLVWMLYSDLRRSGNANWRIWESIKNKPV